VEDIHLTDPSLPPLPLETPGSEDIPRYQGFPNVVMALDPQRMNPNFFAVGIFNDDLRTDYGVQQMINMALEYGVLQLGDPPRGATGREHQMTGPFFLQTGQGTEPIKVGTASEIQTQISDYRSARDQMLEAQARGESKETILKKLQDNQDTAEKASEPIRQVIDAVQAARGFTGIDEGASAANYLTMLGDLKSNFSPGLAVPGYYRYYSSSHPKEENQGMRDVVADEEEEDTTRVAGLVRLDEPSRVRSFRLGDQDNKLVEQTVKVGIPIMRPNTGKEEAQAVPTPTHQIATISFAEHRVRKAIQKPKITSILHANFPSSTPTDIMWPRFAEGAYLNAGGTITERFSDLYSTFSEDLRTVPGTIGLANLSDTSLPDFDAVIATMRGIGNVEVDPDKTVEEQFENEPDGVLSISGALSRALAKPTSLAFARRYTELRDVVGRPGIPLVDSEAALRENLAAYTTLSQQWAETLQSLTGETQSANNVKDGAEGKPIYATDYATKPFYTPVFPVSDERGYEVIGTYAYGRGLSIEPGGNFQTISDTATFEYVSVDAVDAFVASMRKETQPSKALGLLAETDPAAAAELAVAALESYEAGSTAGISGAEVLEVALETTGLFDEQFRAYAASSTEFSQKISAENAAYGLADLGSRSSTVCTCRGADADVLLMAFGSEAFISVDHPDEVSSWLADRMLEQSVPWKLSQDALRGRTLDTGNYDLAAAWEGAKGAFQGGNTAAQGDLNEALGDFETAKENLRNDTSE
jgi:hypothetical protein